MLTPVISQNQTFPLFHEIHEDDQYLLNTIDGEWFSILYYLFWEDYRIPAATYYDALYDFNLEEQKKATQRKADKKSDLKNPETKEAAKQRLLFERATVQTPANEKSQIIYKENIVEFKQPRTNPLEISPGVVPVRLVGRKPKCFFSLLKSFMGVTLMGFPAEPEMVHRLLGSNPSFARVCGFSPKFNDRPNDYHYQQIPSVRKLEQFDQIMTQAGLWEQLKVNEVNTNMTSGIIKPEKEMVGDTTHYYAYSGFETIHYENTNGTKKKKSQSKITKNCRCEDRETCHHEWELADEGAGTIVKSGGKMYWGHKASVLGLPEQGIALDAVAICDAASHDGQTFLPHVKKVFKQYPEISSSVVRVLYDSACDDAKLRQQFKEELNVELKASFNPRGTKAITEDLPRGMEKITATGIPVCQAGHEMDYQGIRHANETFIYKAPLDEEGIPVCKGCQQQKTCCNGETKSGRIITVSFDTLPQINADDPPMSKRFKAIMTRRPSVERMIKRLKCDMGDDRLSKRGNDSFQAYLDKTMIAYHLLLRHLN